jgi:FAD/FMN-containing dehydrogenase
VEIPIQNAPEFMAFFQENIGISPVWTCPVKTYNPHDKFSLYPMDPDNLYINFGFWDVVPSNKEKGYYNRLIEDRVEALQGKKSLYSDSFYTLEKFWQLYNKETYYKLKSKYDPDSRFKNLYDKSVNRQK